jgi:hypothetical protein
MTEQQTVTPFISLDDAVFRVHRKWDRAFDAYVKFTAARLECGTELLALRARIEAGEAGEVRWWNWYKQKFTRSRADAEKIMAIASSMNPELAHAAAKARNAEINRAYRQREQNRSRSREREPDNTLDERQELLPPEPSQQDLIDQIIDLFKRLHRKEQTRCAVKLRRILRGDA